MINHYFRCAQHGIFEEMAEATPFGVVPANCPICAEKAVLIWLKAPAMRNDDVHGVRMLDGSVMPLESAQARMEAIDAKQDEPDFWDAPEFEGEYLEARDRVIGKFYAGELEPIALAPEQQKVLIEGVKQK